MQAEAATPACLLKLQRLSGPQEDVLSVQGLGKTVQTIAFMAALLGKTGTAALDSQRPAPSSDVSR